MAMTSQFTPAQRHLLATYRQDTDLGWITGPLQRHCYIGPTGLTGPITCLCDEIITRAAVPTLGTVFTTCAECWTNSVIIRCRRLPHHSGGQGTESPHTRPNVRARPEPPRAPDGQPTQSAVTGGNAGARKETQAKGPSGLWPLQIRWHPR